MQSYAFAIGLIAGTYLVVMLALALLVSLPLVGFPAVFLAASALLVFSQS